MFKGKILFLTVLMVSWFSYTGRCQQVNYIVLQNQPLNVTPSQFYIHQVDDERNDTTGIGTLITASTNNRIKTAIKGGSAAIKGYINHIFPVDKSLRPLVIKLKTFTVTETALTGGMVSGDVNLSLTFGLQRGEDFIPLAGYTGSNQYKRNAGPAQQLEPILRNTLNNSMLYINNWMNAQADNNVQLAKDVKVSFTDYSESTEGDTIYYHIKRPLKWADFKGKPLRNSRNGAEIFASVGYTEDVKLEKGVFYISLAISVFVPKSACWVSNGDETNYALNHEQRHFDIAKLVGEHFKKNIAAERLDPSNYDGPINVLYLDALREMNTLQKQYDSETDHSRNTYQQQQWNMLIDKQLGDLGVKVKAN